MKKNLIRTIYLYLFALLGLVLIVIGAVGFVQMGLKAYVFTKADEQRKVSFQRPPTLSLKSQLIETTDGELKKPKKTVKLTDEQVNILNNWIEDYNNWEERQEELDPVTSNRHRDASRNLALIIIGLPLYIYHWRIIKKETENEK